jgi:hypothetical protein
MAQIRRIPTEHTTWCTRDHRCGLDEHRGPDIMADDIGGRGWLTRVRAGNTEYVEIRVRVRLYPREDVARWQISTALDIMRELLASVAARLVRLPGRPARRAIGRRAA